MAIIMCRPCDPAPLHKLAPHLPVPDAHPGSTVGHCDTCNEEIWIAPDQMELAEAQAPGPYDVLCTLCTVELMVELEKRGVDVQARVLTDHEVPVRYQDGTLGSYPIT